MKITPVSGPTQINPGASHAADKRANAIKAFQQGAPVTQGTPQAQAQEHPVANPSAVSVEELSAIQPPTQTAQIEQVEQPAPEDAPPAIPKPNIADPAKQKLSSEYAELVRREKQLRIQAQKREQEWKQREEALKQREAEIVAKQQQDLNNYISKDRLKQSAIDALAEAGVSYDDIVQQALNVPQKNPYVEAQLKDMQSKIEKLTKANEDLRLAGETAQKSQYDAALRQIRTDVDGLVKTDPNFETVKATGSQKDVVELIRRTFEEEGRLMTVEEASQEVEDHLVNELSRLAQLKSVQRKFTPKQNSTEKQDQPKQASPAESQPQGSNKMRTLTNRSASSRPLTARERAILAFENKLGT